jgi:large subunit ribosomal protein L31e
MWLEGKKMPEERIYIIPLRRGWIRAPKWKRSKRAIKAIREFVRRHVKVEEVKIGKQLNEFIWSRGSKSPPPRVRVRVVKEENIARVSLVELKPKLKPKPKKPEVEKVKKPKLKAKPKEVEKLKKPKAKPKPKAKKER